MARKKGKGKPKKDNPDDPSTEEEEDEPSDDEDNIPLAELFVSPTKSPSESPSSSEAQLFPLPTLKKGERWAWQPVQDYKFIVMKDGALAAGNAVRNIWGEDTVVEAMCAVHASKNWFEGSTTGRPLFENFKENFNIVLDDFNAFKGVTHFSLVNSMRDHMIHKWKNVLKEKKMADAWMTAWGNSVLTRVEVNEGNVLDYGFPVDNNIVESSNKGDKDFFDRKRHSTDDFVHHLAERAAYVSMMDHKFIGRLKPAVHSGKFYRAVWQVLNELDENKPCFLNCSIKIPKSYVGEEFPGGSYLFPSYNCLKDIKEMGSDSDLGTPKTPTDVIKWLKQEGWIKTYFNMVLKGKEKMPEQAWSDSFDCYFDFMVEYLGTFHVVRPVSTSNPDIRREIEPYLLLLKENDLDPISYEELCERESDKGLVTCDCRLFLHYGWCVHVAAVLMQRGIVRKYPTYMDPTPLDHHVNKKLKRPPGRPRNAKGGEARKTY